MKYSIIMPYYDRLNQLDSTLISFVYLYKNRKDFEVIIIGDENNNDDGLQLLSLIDKYKDKFSIIYIKYMNEKRIYNPAPKFNEGVKYANGDFLILTNPECIHVMDILSGFDNELKKDQDIYIICGCKSLKQDCSFHMWYQHSKLRNKGYHFCSCLSIDNYRKIDGFNEEYKDGWGFDDDSFRARVLYSGITFIYRDDLLTNHLYHDKVKPPNNKEMLIKNQNIFRKELKYLKEQFNLKGNLKNDKRLFG